MTYRVPVCTYLSLDEKSMLEHACASINTARSEFLRMSVMSAISRIMKDPLIDELGIEMHDRRIKASMRRIAFPNTAIRNLRELLAKCVEPKQIIELVKLYERKSFDVYKSRKLRASFRALRKELSTTKVYESMREQAKQVAIMRSVAMLEKVFNETKRSRQ